MSLCQLVFCGHEIELSLPIAVMQRMILCKLGGKIVLLCDEILVYQHENVYMYIYSRLR